MAQTLTVRVLAGATVSIAAQLHGGGRVPRDLEELFPDVALIVTDLSPGSIVLAWSKTAEQMFGWTGAEALGRPGAQIIRSADGAHRGGLGRLDCEPQATTLLDRYGRAIPAEPIRLGVLWSVRELERDPAQRVSGPSQLVGGYPSDGNTQISIDALNRATWRELAETVGANIRRARQFARLSQTELAEALGLGAAGGRHISDHERGIHIPQPTRLAEIRRITNAPSIGWFWDEHGGDQAAQR